MLRVAVFVMLVVMICDVMGDDFTCYPNQTIQFTNPDSATFTYYRAFYYDSGTNTNANCTHNSNDGDVTVIFTCGSTSNNITAYFSDRSLSQDDIIGGAGVKYTFQCVPLSDHNVTLLGNLTAVSVNHTVEASDPFYAITANFFFGGIAVTTATVGQDLTFRINGPSDYGMLPLLCVATGGADSKTLITNGCSDDANLVSDFTMGSSGANEVDYNMTFHAFKFFDSDAVDISCTVKICIDGGCDLGCDRRRRRALSGKDAVDDSAEIASFSKRLIIKDVVLGGSNRAYGSLGLTLALSMLFALIKA